MKFSNKFLLILLIIQPLIDLITSLSAKYSQLSISIGALTKTTFMFVLMIYLIYYFSTQNKWFFAIVIGSYLSIFITLIINFFLKSNYIFFTELNFALKTSYYLTMIYSSIFLFNRGKVIKGVIYRAIKIISIIIGVSYWFSIMSRTAFDSYEYGGAGYSGWFFSANELSVIVIVLLGLTVMNLTLDQTLTAWISFILVLSMVPMIGTKTAFLGGGIILFISVIYALLDFKTQASRMKNILLLVVAIIYVCLIPLTPIASKTADLQSQLYINQMPMKDSQDKTSGFFQRILSSRDIYFDSIKEDYRAANGVRKTFGLGYSGDYTNKPEVIEMDFFDLFFSYGVIGSMFLIAPLLYAIYNILFLQWNRRYIILLVTLGLVLGIASLAGHVIFAPAVMTYIAILLVALHMERKVGEVYE